MGRFKTTSKNFSSTNSNASSVTAGLVSTEVLASIDTSLSFKVMKRFVATLFFFKKAAENPEAQTLIQINKGT